MSIPTERAGSRRVFFALWPNAQLADEIVPRAARLGLGGQLMRPERLHMTLTFIGTTSDAGIERLKEIAEATADRLSRFSVVVDRVACFPSHRTGWFGPSQPPSGLRALAAALDASRPTTGLDRTPFVPHITVARGIAATPDVALFPPLIWHVDRFVLVESGADGVPGAYGQLAEWRLDRC